MKLKISVLIITALILASCNASEDGSTSASKLQIMSLTGNDLAGKAGSTTIFSDVITNGGIINDNGVAAVMAVTINPDLKSTQLTTYMNVIVDQIDVVFQRTDGRNVEGVDVPYHFSQPMNMLLTLNKELAIPFVLIRHVAKMEPPLLALRDVPSRELVLQLIAIVTIHGKDLGGHRVAPVTGYATVWCANFADAEAPTEPEP